LRTKGGTLGVRHIAKVKVSSLNASCQGKGKQRRGKAVFQHEKVSSHQAQRRPAR
jgi:hypothetical protein